MQDFYDGCIIHTVGGSISRMKKEKMDKILVSLISSLLFTGCTTSVNTSQKVKTEEPVITNLETIEESIITKKSIRKYVKEKEEYQDIFQDIKENEIHIEEKTFQGENLYFFLYTPDELWSTTLYQIREKDGEILGLDYISEGATDYFNFDVISISEGDFITVYSANHTGNGNLVLVKMNEAEERPIGSLPDYELYAIDSHYEEMQLNHNPVVSKVFENGVLTPEYKDVNKDGNTDIILKGVLQEYEYDEAQDMQKMKRTEEVCQIYEFDPDKKTFTLRSGEDLKEKKPFALSDAVVNNHALLNETPCTEYRVQDIYQFQGEPIKTIDYEDEEIGYRHYLVYEGIIYVIIGEVMVEPTDFIDYVILTDELYSLAIGIQVGMDAAELEDTGIYFEKYENVDDLDSELLSGKSGYIRKLKIKYDSIYYAEGTFDENIALAVIVKNGKIVRISTDKLY